VASPIGPLACGQGRDDEAPDVGLTERLCTDRGGWAACSRAAIAWNMRSDHPPRGA